MSNVVRAKKRYHKRPVQKEKPRPAIIPKQYTEKERRAAYESLVKSPYFRGWTTAELFPRFYPERPNPGERSRPK